ncbi:chaplin family protein [Streptomyces sp. NPDC003090]|uniref:chaplin n=1 Tax=Streptomyces sp. NPDC003090 TaxID=3154274 RepID=UPI00380F19CF
MRQVTRKGLTIVAAAGGVLALGGYAHATTGAGADGAAANSPGVASGNNVQAPISVPVNACGNTVDVVGVLNPAFGNKCVNKSSGAQANGAATNSPGVASGNNVQAPVSVPVNACGNSVDVVGALNPTFGNGCGNGATPGHPGEPGEPGNPGEPGKPGEPGEPTTPGKPGKPSEPAQPSTPSTPNKPDPHGGTTPKDDDQLAATGASALGLLGPAGAAALIGGTILYRRARAA